MKAGKVNVLIDGQWGSTGKGKIAGFLAHKFEPEIVAAMSSPNAGHTYVADDGSEVMLKQLPISAINKNATVLMTPQCVIDPKRFLQEVEMLDCADRIFVHPHAAVVTEAHKEQERQSMGRISSTCQGTGAALQSRMMRDPKSVASSHPDIMRFCADTGSLMLHACQRGKTTLLEVSQGFDLSLTWGHEYPYVTSRDITTASALNAAGVAPCLLGDVYGSIRTYPIRVGNVYDENGQMTGWSGGNYDDQAELTWDDLTHMSGSPVPLLERTTVTKKVRRVFTISQKQLYRFVTICAPTHIFVNFVNYWDHPGSYGARRMEDLSGKVVERVNALRDALMDMVPFGYPVPEVSYLGTGKANGDMVDLNND